MERLVIAGALMALCGSAMAHTTYYLCDVAHDSQPVKEQVLGSFSMAQGYGQWDLGKFSFASTPETPNDALLKDKKHDAVLAGSYTVENKSFQKGGDLVFYTEVVNTVLSGKHEIIYDCTNFIQIGSDGILR